MGRFVGAIDDLLIKPGKSLSTPTTNPATITVASVKAAENLPEVGITTFSAAAVA